MMKKVLLVGAMVALVASIVPIANAPPPQADNHVRLVNVQNFVVEKTVTGNLATAEQPYGSVAAILASSPPIRVNLDKEVTAWAPSVAARVPDMAYYRLDREDRYCAWNATSPATNRHLRLLRC